MPEPIKVTREQWDGFVRGAMHAFDVTIEKAHAETTRLLGPRPGPAAPPDLRIDGVNAMHIIRGDFDHGTDWGIDASGMSEWDYITPEDGERIRAWLAAVHEWGGVR